MDGRSCAHLVWTQHEYPGAAKPDTRFPPPPLAEASRETCKVGGLDARLRSAGASQVGGWRALLGAGINDWGGLSPLTRDFVNPEKPWPHLLALADATAAEGMALVPRWEALQCRTLNFTAK